MAEIDGPAEAAAEEVLVPILEPQVIPTDAEIIADLVAQRESEGVLGEPSSEEGEPAQEEDSEEAAEAGSEDPEAGEESQPEPEGEADKPSYSQALLSVMEQEKSLRDEKTKFNEERGDFQEKLDAYTKARELASLDPVAFLRGLGVEGDALQKVAEAAYYESLDPDLRPDNYKEQQQYLALKREVAELKSDRVRATEEDEAQTAQTQAVQHYRQQCHEVLKGESTPMVGAALAKAGDSAVAADMVTVAMELEKSEGFTPSPSYVARVLEERYSSRAEELGLAQEAPPPEQAAGRTGKPSLRNKNTKSQKAERSLDDYANSHGDPDDYKEMVAMLHRKLGI
jgi:hypothetical protein